MSISLSKIQISNFVGLQEADIDFGKPISLFAGPNRAGKSSVRDALLFAFTGKGRSIAKFKDAEILAYKDNKDEMQVQLTYFTDEDNQNACVIKRGIKNASKGVENFNALIPFCLDPLSFIRLPARERGAILSGVLGAGLNEAIEEAIAKHIGDISPMILTPLKGTGIDLHNIDALRNEIIIIRRDFKRQEKTLDVPAPKLGKYDLPEDFDILKAESETKILQKQITGTETSLREVKTQQRVQAEIVDQQKIIRDNKAILETLGKTKVPDDAVLKEYELLKHIIAVTEQMENETICPVCQSQFNYLVFEKRREALPGALIKYETQLKEYQEQQDEKNRAGTALATATARIETLQKMIKGTIKAKRGAEEELNQLRTALLNLNDCIVGHQRYRTDVEVYKESQEQIGGLKIWIAECNKIDDALKDGGPVKRDIAAAGKPLPINPALLKVWDVEQFEWKDNGDILLNNRPVERASESEKYMIASVMGLALAEVGNVGFAALDGFEVLVGDNANLFFDAVDSSNINNVLVFGSTSCNPEKLEAWRVNPESLEIFSVLQGEVKKCS